MKWFKFDTEYISAHPSAVGPECGKANITDKS